MKKTIMKTKNAYWFDALRLILFLLTVLIMFNHENLTEQLLIIDADDDYEVDKAVAAQLEEAIGLARP